MSAQVSGEFGSGFRLSVLRHERVKTLASARETRDCLGWGDCSSFSSLIDFSSSEHHGKLYVSVILSRFWRRTLWLVLVLLFFQRSKSTATPTARSFASKALRMTLCFLTFV